jgi:hypothetical protein
MTILEAKNTLFSYFLNNDVLGINSFDELFPDIQNKILNKEIILIALDDFEKIDLIKGITTNPLEKNKEKPEKDSWVLVKPLTQFSQNIEISGITASTIENVINEYCSIYNDEENICQATNISEKEIQNLLKIILSFKDSEKEQTGNDEELEDYEGEGEFE